MDIQSFISNPRCRCLSIAAGLATLCASALILPLTSSAIQAQGAAQRKSATDLSAPEVMSLRRGVAKMMSRNGAREAYRRPHVLLRRQGREDRGGLAKVFFRERGRGVHS